jgi:integrase
MTQRRGPGEGGIDERSPGHYRLRWRVDGKRYAKSVHGSLADARKELRRLLQRADDGAHVVPRGLRLSDWAGIWLESRRPALNTRTWERYEELLRLHVLPQLGHRPLQRLTAPELDELYAGLRPLRSPRTVHHVHVVLGACLRAAVRKGLLVSSPTLAADAPVVREFRAGQALDQGELAALLTGFRGSALYPIVTVAALTGARRNEVLALRWSDFDPAARTLTISRSLEETRAGRRFKEPKTPRGRRTIAIDAGLAALLLGLPAAGPLIFPSPLGPEHPRDARTVTKEFRARARALGFPALRFHDLRGTHETMLLDAGVPVHVVAARCGHDPAILLRTYAHRTKRADTSAAAVLGGMAAGLLGPDWVQGGGSPVPVDLQPID